MAESMKRKIASEYRTFETQWENKYFFIEVKGRSVSAWFAIKLLQWWKNIMYDYTMKPKIKPTRPTLMPSENRKLSKWQLDCKLNNSIFSVLTKQENATIASYEVAQLIARHRNAGIQQRQHVREHWVTLVNLKHQVWDKTCSFDFCLIACDECFKNELSFCYKIY